jgi:tetratricopeptide (TPR) repeat protein
MSIKLNLYKTALRKKAEKGFQGFPVATVAYYGPNDRVATKVVVGIEESETSEGEILRWHSPALDIRRNADVLEEIVKLLRRRDVKSVAMTEAILGCPHEEGVDYPEGEVCPDCPYWANRSRPIVDDDDLPESRAVLPDRRAMEKTLARIASTRQAATSVEKAQEIMWDAWEEPNRKRRIELAKKALTISEDCADAFVLLAEEAAPTLKDAMQLFEQGVRAGERALGEQSFAEYAGQFWGHLETRPYMRARAGLAECLEKSGKPDEAIQHYVEMLRLNPNDNQGIRDSLGVCYIATGRDPEALELLQRYPEGIKADWLYSMALLAFRHSGADANSRGKLRDAVKRNPHVPDFLFGRSPMPRSIPPHYAIGSRDEAIIYVRAHGDNWRNSEGALEWLKREFTAASASAD